MEGFLVFLQSLSVIPNHTPAVLLALFAGNILGLITAGIILGLAFSEGEDGYEIR